MLQQNPISMMCAECRVSKTHVAYQKHTLRIKKISKTATYQKMYQKTHRFLEGFFMKNAVKMAAQGTQMETKM